MNRIASGLSDNSEHFISFRDILLDMRFMPAGRIQAAIGSTRRTTPYNCFVSGTIEDSMVEGHGCIIDRFKEAMTTMRMGGGIGYDFSTLRPRGATIKKLHSKSSGPISFMEIFNAGCLAIASAGHRRGAQMGVLRVDHPDIEEFIHAKQNQNRLTGFNISIGITDEFMRAVKADTDFNLRWDGEVYGTVRASSLWSMIMRSTWDWAEPGVLFIDRINEMNNLFYCENIAATNPCFTGDTCVWTDGGGIPFRELVGHEPMVLTQSENGKLVYRRMRNIRVTQRNAALVRVSLDNGTSVECTPEHKFFLKDGRKVEAQNLRAGDSIQSVYRYRANQKGYVRLTNGLHQPLEHHVPFANIPEGFHAHHLNGRKDDNRIQNLELKEACQHLSDHMTGDNNPQRRFPERNPVKLNPALVQGKNNGRYRHELNTEEMLTLRSSGHSFGKIASLVGCSKYTVQKRIRESNHRVIAVEFLDKVEDVYCGSVEETGRFFVATGVNDGVLVSNCAEQPLPPYGACLLGSFNLVKYLVKGDESDKVVDFDMELFKRDISTVVRAMDKVVDVAVYPLYEQEKEAKNKRRMGLGITGLANTLEALDCPYGGPSFIAGFERIMKVLVNEAYRSSALLAQEKGAFPKYNPAQYPFGKFIQRLDADVQQLIAQHGIRNSHLISIAPTGTISLCADNVSSGIEPVFAYSFNRTVREFAGDRTEVVEDYGVKFLGVKGKVSADVTVDQHLAVLTAAYRWVDSAVSKTCNVPSNTDWEDFKSIYMRAWEEGCKGCTTFQTGGKRAGVLETTAEATENVKEESPQVLACSIDPETGRKTCE